MYEIREVLRVWLGAGGAGPAPGLPTIAARSGVDRKTVRRYVEAAQAAGLQRSDSPERIDDELVGVVVDAVRPARPAGHGAAGEALVPFEEQIRAWVNGEGDTKPLPVTKIEICRCGRACRFGRCGDRCGPVAVPSVPGSLQAGRAMITGVSAGDPLNEAPPA